MASLVLFINGEKCMFDSLLENEKDSIKIEIESKFQFLNENENRNESGIDESIRITSSGNLDTNLSTPQIPREIYTINPLHPSYSNKLVQFRFKLDSETEQQTESRNELFLHVLPDQSTTPTLTRTRNISSNIPPIRGGPPPPAPRPSEIITDADIDFLDAWDPP